MTGEGPVPGYTGADLARLVGEPARPGRTAFQRDRARVLHSSALRRLAGTTQVVGVGEDDFPRTRLTHSLECAQIGRELGAALGCDPDLVDAACLAHDLGHPPFGHNGETALDQAAAGCGGFEGNAQSLRILTRLEPKVLTPEGVPVGLNLTRAALDAATKYPWSRRRDPRKYGYYEEDAAAFDWLRAGAADGRRCMEAEVMDWADDVAYSVHDLEDGIHAGHVALGRLDDPAERERVCALTAQLYTGGPAEDLVPVLDALRARPEWPPEGFDGGLRALVALKAACSALITRFAGSALAATRAAAGPGRLTRHSAVLSVPAETRAECALLKGITARYVMGRPGAGSRQERERELVTGLVAVLTDRAPGALEPALRPAWAAAPDDAGRLRVVVDQVARLTDASARAWRTRLAAG